MLHLGDNRARNKVNVLKKVKVNGQWKLCPAVLEPDGKLKDRVQVNGRTQVHSEGVYYIEWREDNQRRRQSVSNRNLVLEHARLKALELDVKKAGITVEANATSGSVAPLPFTAATSSSAELPLQIDSITSAAGLILRSVESYLQELIKVSVRSQLQNLGITIRAEETNSASLFPRGDVLTAGAVPSEGVGPAERQIHSNGKAVIAEAIEAYLKDIKPPQREQKTYDEYRLVLLPIPRQL